MHTLRCRATIAAIALLAILSIAGAVAYSRLPDIDTLLLKPATPSILIADRHGRVLYEAIDPMGSKHVPLALSDIPPACRQATIATEDERFYSHPGVDLLSIARAAWANWRAGEIVSGASTLTQQLARNLMLPEGERYEQSLSRKLREAWLAWRLEQRYSKDELLALYLNTTYYGHFATGIEAAAQAYFGVHAGELDLSQCALLADCPNGPRATTPSKTRTPHACARPPSCAAWSRRGTSPQNRPSRPGTKRSASPALPFRSWRRISSCSCRASWRACCPPSASRQGACA